MGFFFAENDIVASVVYNTSLELNFPPKMISVWCAKTQEIALLFIWVFEQET